MAFFPTDARSLIPADFHYQLSHLPPPPVSEAYIYVCLYIQSLFSSVLPLKGEDILPSQFQLLGRGLPAHPKVFGVNLQLGGMFLA